MSGCGLWWRGSGNARDVVMQERQGNRLPYLLPAGVPAQDALDVGACFGVGRHAIVFVDGAGAGVVGGQG